MTIISVQHHLFIFEAVQQIQNSWILKCFFNQPVDEVRHMLIETLNRSFATPIDQEEIFALAARAIDNILDYGYSTGDEMVTLNVKPNA